MNNQYQIFKDLKQKDKLEKIKQRSILTLEWYNKIGEMLDDPLYEDSQKFLVSISEWIETKEYVTEGQVTALENMIKMYDEHGHYMVSARNDVPFD